MCFWLEYCKLFNKRNVELFQAVESLTCCVRYLTQSAESTSVDPVRSQDILYYIPITYFFEIVPSSMSHFSPFCLHFLFATTYATCACCIAI